MATKKDPLDTEISASVTVTDSGVEAKLKSRATSAFDRLCGSAFEFLGLKIERENSKERATMEAERAVIAAAAKSMTSRIESNSEYADRMIENHLEAISRKQRNKDAIGKIAYEEIKQLPPPDAAAIEKAPESIDEDWLNRFEAIAETASTERMQQLFGKILSGEIRKPGAFSLTTLRVASELSQRTAKLFQDLAAVRIGDAIVEFDEKGNLGTFLDLEVAGLINYDNIGLGKSMKSEDNKTVIIAGDEVYGVFEVKNPKEPLVFPMIRLTTVGHELAVLISNDETRAMKTIIEKCKARIIKAELFKILGSEDDDVIYEDDPFETIRFRDR